MKLADLEANFVKTCDADVPRHSLLDLPPTTSPFDADGIMFICPLCQSHSILVWFKDRSVPAYYEPKARWGASGTGLHDLTVTPSINLDVPGATGCKWHGHIINGEAK